MNEYLSFGAGVNSVALMLLLQDQGREFESVFVNHGGDHPDTYNHVKYLREQGYEITEVIPNVSWKGHWDKIYDYFYYHKSIPFIAYRICTDKFKIKPFNKYIEKPAIVYIGYDYGEGNRVRKQRKRKGRKGISYEYPLYDNQLTRNGCIDYIKSHNLDVPPKSGCFFCPFQSKSEWKELLVNDPVLFKKALELEENANRDGLYLGCRRLSSIYQENTLDNYVGFDGNLSCHVWKCRE